MWENFKRTSTLITTTDLNNFRQNVPKIRDSVDPVACVTAVKQTIEKVITIHLGVRPGLLSDHLLEAVIAEIIQNYNGLTLRDIEHAYERHQFPERNDWRNVTKAEIMAPLIAWNNMRARIANDWEKCKAEEIEKAEGLKKAAAFKEASRIKYNEAVEALEWSGTIYEAAAIAKDIAQHIDQARKDEMWAAAKQKAEDIETANAKAKRLGEIVDFDRIGRTPKRLMAEMIVLEGIKNGVKI